MPMIGAYGFSKRMLRIWLASNVDFYGHAGTRACFRRSRRTIISINRFERKKNIALAIHAFAHLREFKLVSEAEFDGLRLIIAGTSVSLFCTVFCLAGIT